MMTIFKLHIKIEAGRGTGGRGTKCACKRDWLWVRSPLEEMKYLFKFIFPFLRAGLETKCGVEFRQLARNASIIRRKVGNKVSHTRFPLPSLLYAGYSVKLIYITIEVMEHHEEYVYIHI